MARPEITAVSTVKLELIRNALASVLLVVLVAACATGPEVHTMSAPDLNLAAYGTYNYVPNPGTDRGAYRSLTTRYLEDATDREMSARGLIKTTDHPQLLVNFRATVRDKVHGTWGPAYGWGWGGWGPGWGWGWGAYGFAPGWWGPGPGPGPGAYGPGWGDIETYSEGTLTLDVIDATSRNVVWSGSAVSPVTRAALEHPQESINQTVAAVFARFPRSAGAAAH